MHKLLLKLENSESVESLREVFRTFSYRMKDNEAGRVSMCVHQPVLQ